jgi:hypothetical protein
MKIVGAKLLAEYEPRVCFYEFYANHVMVL